MKEDKSNILSLLYHLVRATRAGSEVKSLEYALNNGDEFVTISFENGYRKKVCVTADSGIALIRDVVKEL